MMKAAKEMSDLALMEMEVTPIPYWVDVPRYITVPRTGESLEVLWLSEDRRVLTVVRNRRAGDGK